MSTNNAVNSPLSGTTGSGSFVGSNSPTLVTPTLGAAIATSIAFSPSTGGIIGTTAGDNVTAGDVGQFVSSVIASGAPITVTSTNVTDITSIALTAGDWYVWGNFAANATVSFSEVIGWANNASVTQPDSSLYTRFTGTCTKAGFTVPMLRFNSSGAATIYLSVKFTGTTTLTGWGGIYALRIR